MNTDLWLALILAAPLLIPATWFAHFLYDPWPRGTPPLPFIIEVTFRPVSDWAWRQYANSPRFVTAAHP